MTHEDFDTQKQTDRDILVDARSELRHVKENVARIETSMDARFERMEVSIDARFLRAETRMDRIYGSVQLLRDNQNTTRGGIATGKWVIGALPTLPFLGALVLWLGQRGA